jgi:uridine kinase
MENAVQCTAMNRQELLDNLAERIDAIHRTHPVRVAIDGPTAAGKTTLADELVAPLEGRGRTVLRASIDGFHHPRARRYRNGADFRAYYHDSFDYLAIRRCVLDPLGPAGEGVYTPAVFDFRTDSPVDHPPEEAPADAVLLFDGVMLLREELREHWDYCIFVHVDTHTAAQRTANRDAGRQGGASKAREAYLGRYMPGQRHYERESLPHRQAHAVVINDHPESPALLWSAGTTGG